MARSARVLSRRVGRPFWNGPFGCLTSAPWKVKQQMPLKGCGHHAAEPPHTVTPSPETPETPQVLRWTLLSVVPEVMIIIITARAEMCVFIQPFKGGDDRDFIQTSDQLVVFIAAG